MEKASHRSFATFLVGGQHFTINVSTLEFGPSSKLKQLYACATNKQEPIAVDRPPDMFCAILAFYQTNELHIPMTSCPNAFLKELQFWEIGVENMSDCCLTRYDKLVEKLLRCFLCIANEVLSNKENLKFTVSSRYYNCLSTTI